MGTSKASVLKWIALAAIASVGVLLSIRSPEEPWPDESLIKRIKANGRHCYTAQARQGESLSARVRQQGVDLKLELLDQDGGSLLSIDSPYGIRGEERVAFVAGRAGDLKLCVLNTSPRKGSYQMTAQAPRQATARDLSIAKAVEFFSMAATTRKRAQRLRQDGEDASGGFIAARGFYSEALELSRQAEDLHGIALAHHRIAKIELDLENTESAASAYQNALRAAEATGWGYQQAEIYFGLARTFFDGWKLEEAQASFSQAIELYRSEGAVFEQGRSQALLGWTYERQGKLKDARSSYLEALSLAEASSKAQEIIIAHSNLGELDLRLGQPELAVRRFEKALELARPIEQPRQIARLSTSLGTAERRLGKLESGRRRFESAIEIQRELGDPKLANTLLGLGLTGLGEYRLDGLEESRHRAWLDFRAAQKEAAGNRRTEALAVLGQAEALGLAGELEKASKLATAAHEALEAIGDRQGLASASFVLATLEREKGATAASLAWIREAIDEVESILPRARDGRDQRSYFAFKRNYYDLLIDLLWDLYQETGDSSLKRQSLEVSERSRARDLRTTLERSWIFSEGESNDFLLEQPSRVSLVELTRQLEDETLVLEYHLGETRSFLWAVTSSTVEQFELPRSRGEISNTAREAHFMLQSGDDPSPKLEFLSRELIGPVEDLLQDRRLVFVGDGALQTIPLGILPDPRDEHQESAEPLVVRHEVIYLPSLAVLGALRGREPHPSPWTLAAVGDPVQEFGLVASAQFPQLRFAGREIELIQEKFLPQNRKVLKGQQATKEKILGGQLSSYGILHFATHGVIDWERPELSGLLLSSPRGKDPVHAWLYSHEIFQLELSAELAVLSACETAIGPEVRGEGLMSLQRGFMAAGVPRVVVSLWSVNDEATADLMVRFYSHLLENSQRGMPLSPAAALRQAQIEIRRIDRWRAPYYWAGFILQGDWS